MGFRTHADQQDAIIAARVERAKRETIAQIYQERQEFVRCEANDRAILEVIKRWTGYDANVLPSKAIFDQAISENPDELKHFARTTLDEAKEQVIEEYLQILSHKSRQDRYSLESERRRLVHLSLPEVRQKLAEIKLRQQMSTQSVGALKQVLADSKPTYGYPQFPQEVYQDGKLIVLDANTIGRMHSSEITRLIRIYGLQQVNARLAGK
jgi:hypothetical protein